MLYSTAALQHCVVLKMKCTVLCYILEPPALNLQGWGQLQWTPFRKCQRCMGSLGLYDECAVPGYWFRVLVSCGGAMSHCLFFTRITRQLQYQQ